MRVVGRNGFTIIEALVAVVVLATGILVLAGSAALTSRMIGRGGLSTRIGMAAASRADRLRRVAHSTVPACTAPEWRDDSTSSAGWSESWQILDASGPARRVRIVVRAIHPTGTSTDTVVTGFLCGSP